VRNAAIQARAEIERLAFRRTWRPYQQRVLDAATLDLADRKLHVVAFSDCLREILSPIENPRYLIVREGMSLGGVAWVRRSSSTPARRSSVRFSCKRARERSRTLRHARPSA
jgi:hypothetical protein